jgi:Zn-dependent peptidase ImmA (M78 family)
MITYERELEIRYKAMDLLKVCKINTKKPIDIKRIIEYCTQFKIYHIDRRLSGLLGFSCYFCDTNEYLIVTDITGNNIYQRHRLTLGHEIGHVVLGHLRFGEDCSFIIVDKQKEREAFIFADELLMPTVRCINLGFDTADQISNYFQVSVEAAANKLKYLDQNALYFEYIGSGLVPFFKLR